MTAWTRNLTGRSNNGHIINCPSSTTVRMWTPYFEEGTSDDSSTAPSAYYCSLVSLMTLRQSTAFSKHVFRSALIYPDDSLSNSDHRAYTELLLMLSEMAAASESIVTPVSEKKLRWVKQDLSRNSGHTTGHRALLSPWFPPDSGWSWSSPQIKLVHEWQVLLIERPEREHEWARSSRETNRYIFGVNTILYRWRRTRKPACEEQKIRTIPTSARFLVEVRPSCLCSCTNDWYSDLQASVSAPLTHPFSSSPSSNMSKSCMGAWSSPTIRIRGQNQLNSWPITDLAATVDNPQLTKSSRNFLQSRLNFFFK